MAKILRNVAAAYTLKNIGSIFQIRAYENAADSIDQSTAEVFDLWQEGKLSEVPNLGAKIQGYLNELFTKGKVAHFEDVQRGIRPVVFELLSITGIGPKTAQKIAELGVLDLEDLRKKIKSGELVKKGFSAKLAQRVMLGLQNTAQWGRRMLLPYAAAQAGKILDYLKKSPDVLQVHPLGSLRRMVPTVGDLDFSASSNDTKQVVDYFCQMPGVVRILDQGENKATVVLQSGVQADLLVGKPKSYGALLQHFTGSKSHNIKLRTIAEKRGLSLSELTPARTEEEFYKILGMQVPPPEIREDTGEIEAALNHELPRLVNLDDIKGDLHLHSNFPIENPSHGPGVDSVEEMIKKGKALGYEFTGISDHAPAFKTSSKLETTKWVNKRTKFIQQLNTRTKSIRILNGLEIDILSDGLLSVSDEDLSQLDYCIAGIHVGHRGSKDEITVRLLKAMQNPQVDIISHPTNRLLNERESSEADWETIFEVAFKNHKLLEINGYPNRLDLRDDLVRCALKFGVKFIISTDAHQLSQMDNMKFGVAVARRGWVQKDSVVNTWDWKKFAEWFKMKI